VESSDIEMSIVRIGNPSDVAFREAVKKSFQLGHFSKQDFSISARDFLSTSLS